jgi:alkanesulfonate monooxygenase SsuD/methylene tetrahydromethanopterin reductase-like flavin-dependent oxidoreductase (luciferase family)
MLPVGDMDGPGGRTPAWADVRATAEAAEESGLDSVWIADHLLARMPDGTVHGMHDAWTLLSAVAAVTSRVELGPLVLCSSFRSPSVIANMAATLDTVAGGRLVLGLGAGWHDPEYEAFGFPTDHRVSRFAEALEIVARLLRGERVTFDGRYYAVSDASLTPAPSRRIPVLVAAKLPRMLRLTARWADAWNTAWFSSPDERLQERLGLLEEAIAAESRAEPELVRTLGIVVGEEDTPSDVARGLETWAELGFHHVIAQPEPLTPASVERLASGVRAYRGR